MHSIDELLHLVHSDGAEELRLRVGERPIVVMGGEPQFLDGLALTAEDIEQFLQSLCPSRQRRELREQGTLEFVYRFRERVDFVVQARIENEQVSLVIH